MNLQLGFRSTFTGKIRAPLPLVLLQAHSFGTVLSPVTSSAQALWTSELLRFL